MLSFSLMLFEAKYIFQTDRIRLVSIKCSFERGGRAQAGPASVLRPSLSILLPFHPSARQKAQMRGKKSVGVHRGEYAKAKCSMMRTTRESETKIRLSLRIRRPTKFKDEDDRHCLRLLLKPQVTQALQSHSNDEQQGDGGRGRRTTSWGR